MAQCKNCEKRGIFLTVDNNGLCKNCSAIVLPQLLNDCRIAVESGSIVSKSKNQRTIISRCDVGLAALARILPFERKGIPALTSPVNQIASEFRSIKSTAFSALINEQVFAARAKQESATTAAAKLGGYTRAIDKLNQMLLEFDDVSLIEPAIDQLVKERDSVSISIAWLKVEKLLAKGKLKQAKELLSDTLIDIKHDTTPDEEQEGEIGAVVEKISEIESMINSKA